jgi:hypothetical protein
MKKNVELKWNDINSRKAEVLKEKSDLMFICPPPNSYAQTRDLTGVSAVNAQ